MRWGWASRRVAVLRRLDVNSKLREEQGWVHVARLSAGQVTEAKL